ncbi:MAG: hypothetical protein ACJAVI_000447 [Candidatus Azotimanducaceae bacterium]|jgi:hypothetical protein
MEILDIISISVASIALSVASAALYMTIKIRQKLGELNKPAPAKTNENFSEIATMMSDGSIVWQRLVIQCDELSAMIPGSVLQGSSSEAVGDWLTQLKGFCRTSKSDLDQAYQLFMTGAKSMEPDDLAFQRPEMEKFSKEMKSNIVVISDQLNHIKSVLRGVQTLGNKQMKITLHQPQGIPHFLRKRKKIAELQARQANQYLKRA